MEITGAKLLVNVRIGKEDYWIVLLVSMLVNLGLRTGKAPLKIDFVSWSVDVSCTGF